MAGKPSQGWCLILTHVDDIHVDHLIRLHGEHSRHQIARLNTEHFYENVELRVGEGGDILHLRDSGLTVPLLAVETVWNRRPRSPFLEAFDPPLSPDEAGYMRRHAYACLQAIYQATYPSALWLNPPEADRRASNKLHQLRLAASLGLNVPPYILSNDPDVLLDFIDTQRKVCTKLIGRPYAHEPHDLYVDVATQRIGRDDIERERAAIMRCPIFLQRYIPKRYDIRISLIDGAPFACRIDPFGHEDVAARTDFRKYSMELPHIPFEAPPDLVARMQSYLDAFGLNAGYFDFVEDEEGTITFLECNPNGQWLWKELVADLPITAHLASVLFGRDPKSDVH